MSVAAMSWAFGVGSITAHQKLVLLALADHANGSGECWPSMPSLAEKTCMCVRAIRYAIRELETAGLIESKIQRGRNHTSRYRLALKNRHAVPDTTPAKPARGAANEPARGADYPDGKTGTVCAKTGTSVQKNRHPVPPNHKEPSRTVREETPDRLPRARGEPPPPRAIVMPPVGWPRPPPPTVARRDTRRPYRNGFLQLLRDDYDRG